MPQDHDKLVGLCENIMAEIRSNWIQGCTVDEVCAVWSKYPTADENIANFKTVPLPDGAKRFQFILELVLKQKAYAVLLVERKSNHIRLLFESLGGSAGWLLPIQGPPGGRRLGKLRTSTNLDSVGILWRPGKGQA